MIERLKVNYADDGISSLAKKYAKKFCVEYPKPKIAERPTGWFDEEGKTFLWNGENGFGPVETWPAQLDNFGFLVSRVHSHRKIDYTTLKHIILLEKPDLLKRDYTSASEYQITLEKIFDFCIHGMKHGKIRSVYEKEMERKGLLFRIRNRGSKRSALKSPLLNKRIQEFRESVPKYSGLRALCFN